MALLLSAGLVVVGGAYAYSGYRNGEGADGAVRGYLTALAAGNAPTALSYGALPVGSQTFLTSAVLRDQLKLAPIRNITIGTDSPTGGDTTVSFSYDLAFARGDQHVQDTVLVRKVGSRWRLDRVAVSAQLTLLQANDRATFAGAAVPDNPALLFPGAVPIGFDTPYLRLSLASDQLRLSQTGPVSLAVELTPAATAAVDQQLATMLTACGHGGTTPAMIRCPVPSPEFVPGSMSGHLAAVPSGIDVQLQTDPAGSIVINGQATFDGTYRSLDFNDVAQVHRGKLSVPFTAQGYAVPPLSIVFAVYP